MDYITLYLIMATVCLLLINSLIVVSNMATGAERAEPREKTVNRLSTDLLFTKTNNTETKQTRNLPIIIISVGTVSAAILATTLFLLVNFDNYLCSHLVLPLFDYFPNFNSVYGNSNLGDCSVSYSKLTGLNLELKTLTSSEPQNLIVNSVTSYKIFSKFVLLLTFLVVISVKPYILKETSLLVLLSTAGILLMANSTNFISFYLALELISLASYILVSTTITDSQKFKNSETRNLYLPESPIINKSELVNDKFLHKSKQVETADTVIVAGLNYFLLSALSSGLLVLGISLIYYTTGELDFNSLARIFSTKLSTVATTTVDLTLDLGLQQQQTLDSSFPCLEQDFSTGLGMCLVMAFVLFKLGASPFHYWVADVYSKVDIFVNYFLIVVGKLAMLFALMKLSFGIVLPLVGNLLIVAAVSSLVVGSFAGLVQTKLRRLMAFSSINHVGYILLAYSFSLTKKETATDFCWLGVSESWKQDFADHVNLAQSVNIPNIFTTLDLSQLPMIITTVSKLSIASLWLYVIIYSLSTLCFFAILSLAVENENGKNLANNSNLSLQRLNTLAIFSAERLAPQSVDSKINNKSVSNPGTSISPMLLSASLTITLLSLAGVPPLAGFVAKIAIFWQVLDSGNWLLATAAVLCSVIAAIYYLRIVAFVWFYPQKLEKPNTTNISFRNKSTSSEKSIIHNEFQGKTDNLDYTFLTALIIAVITISLVVFPLLNPSFIYLYMICS